MATTTAVIVLYEEAVLIWEIPPLSPHADSKFFARYPTGTHLPPPLFKITFPDDIVPRFIGLSRFSSWYCCSLGPLYFDMSSRDMKLHTFQIILKPDLSSVSLHVNTYRHDSHWISLRKYRICEDTLVSSWIYEHEDRQLNRYQCGIYTSPQSTNGGPPVTMVLPDIGRKYAVFLCPTSGRCVRLNSSDMVAVLDFF